jgi:hypothetical protein
VATERTSAAVIRAWLEADDEAVFKVRVACVSETGELTTIGTATDVEAACEIVRRWLRGLVDCRGPAGR